MGIAGKASLTAHRGGKAANDRSIAHLIELAQRRLLVRTPAQELCAVTKTAAGKVIVLEFSATSGSR